MPVLLLGALAACAAAKSSTPMPVDLLRALPGADTSPKPDPGGMVRADFVTVDSSARPALIMATGSRVIWQVQMIDRAALRATVGILTRGAQDAEATIRVGISDELRYEDLLLETIRAPAPGAARTTWHPLDIDLSRYSGWQWSVFYQPSRRAWNIVLNVRGADGLQVAFVEPRIEAR